MVRTVAVRLVVVGVLVMMTLTGGIGIVAADDTGSGDCDDTERELSPACARGDNRATSEDIVDRAETALGETPNGDKVIRILKKKLPS
ncbi:MULTISPECIES: hypothetical protein [Haloferax]|uniref:Uncharacterized protein n=1 Tax=Haloferax marinum TaxID=2666143 RepID=A0A6A8GCW1_9EURY|nr:MULTISPECIES: hypothetical protein [Haloferax]KAB1198690.1 hypothetical protein Hfx1150_14650 [Haloferax sp. CBA1150]MRW97806.1 hypothetical protein [Haloferax marinum]